MKTIPPSVKTIPDLVTWLADEYHEGHPSRMHAKLGISVATGNFWARGAVLPNLQNLERICTVYSLPVDKVFELWRKSNKRRGALGLVLGLLLFFPAPSGAAPPGPPYEVDGEEEISLIRHWLRRLWAWTLHAMRCPA